MRKRIDLTGKEELKRIDWPEKEEKKRQDYLASSVKGMKKKQEKEGKKKNRE